MKEFGRIFQSYIVVLPPVQTPRCGQGEVRGAQLGFKESEGLNAAGLAQFVPLDPVLTVKFPAPAPLPCAVCFESAIPQSRKFASHVPVRLQSQSAPANERLDCRDCLFDSACLFANAGFDVEQKKLAEVARCRSELPRLPGQRDAVHVAQESHQCVAPAIAQPVIEALEVFVAARLAALQAAVAQQRRQIGVTGFVFARELRAGIVRCPQVRPRCSEVLGGEAALQCPQPAIRVPGTQRPALVLQVGAGYWIDPDVLTLEIPQIEVPVACVRAHVAEQRGGIGGLFFLCLLEQVPQLAPAAPVHLCAGPDVVERPLPPIEHRLDTLR